MGLQQQFVLLIALLSGAYIGVFVLFAATSCSLSRLGADANELRALVVSDIHLLGKRRRSWIERAWIDLQVTISAYTAVRAHKPDLVLVLGDQLDEGGLPTPQSDWEEYITRFDRALASFRSLPTLYLAGNHDTAFGRSMRAVEVARYERAFGASNYIEYVGDHAIVGVNTMALDADVTSADVHAQASDFLESVDTAKLQARTARGSVVLLTHLPLYRTDDLRCGDARIRESGHVTYEHPSFAYDVHHHVLSRELSELLLATFAPHVVLSGHTHAWCAFSGHADGTREFTVPAFSWGQRPDPSYALLSLTSEPSAVTDDGNDDTTAVRVVQCALPDERVVFALLGVTAVTFALLSSGAIAIATRMSQRLTVALRRKAPSKQR